MLEKAIRSELPAKATSHRTNVVLCFPHRGRIDIRKNFVAVVGPRHVRLREIESTQRADAEREGVIR